MGISRWQDSDRDWTPFWFHLVSRFHNFRGILEVVLWCEDELLLGCYASTTIGITFINSVDELRQQFPC